MQPSIRKNTAYNMIKTLASIIFPLITFPYISRVLQPENVGKVNFGSSIVSYFSLAATLGVTTYAIRECSATRGDQKKLERTASEIISINTVTMLLSYAALILCLIFVPKLADYRLLIAIQSLSIFFTVIGADWLNTSMEDFRYITLRTVAFQFVSLVLMFLFVKGPEDYIIYGVISLVASSAGNLCNVFYRHKYGNIHLVRQMNWKKHMPAIMGLFVMLLSQTIMGSIDQTMLGFIKGDYEVGLYSVASKVVQIILQVVASIIWVVMPQLTQGFDNKDYKSINAILHKTLNFTITLAFPSFVGLVILSKEVLILAGGQEYVSSATCLVILAVGMVFDLVWGNLWGNCVLLPSRKERQFTIACWIAMLINVIGNYVLIPQFGIVGAAIATVFSKFMIGIIVIQKRDKNIDMGINAKMIIGPVVGCAVIIAVCILVKLLGFGTITSTGLSIFLSAFTYGLIMILFKNEIVLEYLDAVKAKVLNYHR